MLTNITRMKCVTTFPGVLFHAIDATYVQDPSNHPYRAVTDVAYTRYLAPIFRSHWRSAQTRSLLVANPSIGCQEDYLKPRVA